MSPGNNPGDPDGKEIFPRPVGGMATSQDRNHSPKHTPRLHESRSNPENLSLGSAGAFDATEETREDLDSDEDNDDLAWTHRR